jgi:hypothetical protein
LGTKSMSKSGIPVVSNVAKVVSSVAKGDLKEAGKALIGGVLPPKIAQAVAPVVGFALGGPAGAAAASAATQFVTGSGKPLERLGNAAISGATGYGLGSLGAGLGAVGGQGFGALGSSLGLGGGTAASASGGLGSMGGQLLGSAFPTVGAAGGAAGGLGSLGGSFLGNAFPYVGASPNILGSGTSLGTLGNLTNSIFGGGGQTVDAIANGAGQLLGLGGGGGSILGGIGGQATGMGGQQGGILSGLLGGGGLGGLSAQDLLIGGGSLASSIYGANVAEKAAKSQREAIDNAIASLREGQGTARGDIQSAMADTNALIQQQNPITQQALDDSNALLGRQNTITQQALDDANALLQQSQGTINQGFDSAASTINPFYQSGTAGLGQLQQLAMGQGVPEFLATNPAYQFRQQEAQRALERSAAARGGLLSGQFAKALQERSQGLASEEFGNAFNRLSGLVGMGQQAGTQLAGLQTQRTGALANVMGARAGLRERAGERFAGTLGAQAGLRERAGERFAGTVGAQAENRARGGQLLGGMSQGFAGSLADLMRSRGDAVATGQIGQTNAYNQGLANLTQYATAPKYRFATVGV